MKKVHGFSFVVNDASSSGVLWKRQMNREPKETEEEGQTPRMDPMAGDEAAEDDVHRRSSCLTLEPRVTAAGSDVCGQAMGQHQNTQPRDLREKKLKEKS